MRPRKSSVNKVSKPAIIKRKNIGFKSIRKLTPDKIEEASSIDITGIPKSTLSRMESCRVQITRYTASNEKSNKHEEAKLFDSAVDTDDVDVNIRVSKDQIISDNSTMNTRAIGMKVDISSANSLLTSSIVSNIVISELEEVGDRETVTVEKRSAVSSPKILRRSARTKEINSNEVKKNVQIPKLGIGKQLVPIITPIQRANSIWVQLISQSFELSVGMIVCAKMKTFWPWPAQIIRFQNQKAKVKFFGDLREGCVEQKHCVPFNQCAFLAKSYIESIPTNSRNEYIKLLHSEYNVKTRPKFLKSLNIRGLYMQAIEDVGLYLDIKKSILREYISQIQ